MGFTARDAGRQAAFLREMYVADAAARRGDRIKAQTALRSALLAGGYNIFALNPAAGVACGRPAFDIPTWLLTASAAIGDSDGANYAARHLPTAGSTVDGLILIAQAQAGLDSERKNPYIFQEAIPHSGPTNAMTECEFRPHDFSALKRLHVAPRPRQAGATLREALPFALVADRADERGQSPFDPFHGLWPSAYALGRLVQRQAELGDFEGVGQSLKRARTPMIRITALFGIADDQRKRSDARALTTEQTAVRLLATLPNPPHQAFGYFQLAALRVQRNDVRGTLAAMNRSLDAAGKIANVDLRGHLLSLLPSAVREEQARRFRLALRNARLEDKKSYVTLLDRLRKAAETLTFEDRRYFLGEVSLLEQRING